MERYSHISDVNIIHAASFTNCDTPPSVEPRGNEPPESRPPPHPPDIQVHDVSEYECAYDSIYPVGVAFQAFDTCPVDDIDPPDNSHYFWDTHMFPSHELEDRSISPSTILQLLAKHDATHFTKKVTRRSALLHHFRLNVDGGANRSVTNNLDVMHTSWDSSIPYWWNRKWHHMH